MSLTETIIFSFSCLCRWQKRLFSLFHAYVVDRSDYFLFFMLMSLTETFIFSFSCLCRWQKRLFSLFHAYVVDRSDYFLFLAFPRCAEACFFSFWPFCTVQKRVFSLFSLSAPCRNKQKCKITCNITILYLFLQNKNDYEIFNFILHLVYNYQLFFYSKG